MGKRKQVAICADSLLRVLNRERAWRVFQREMTVFGWMARTPYCQCLRKPSLRLNHYSMEYNGNHFPGAIYELWSFPRPCFLMSQTAETLLVIFSAISMSPFTEIVSVLADAVIYVFLS